MKAYELLFFVDPSLDPETRLAYEINDLTDGDYTLINFHADPTQIAELDRVLRITDAVVRHMIVRRDDQE